MHRPTVGIIALVLLLAAILSLVLGSDGRMAWGAGCLKVGVLMGTFWLAMPHLKGVRPRWLFLGLTAGIVVLVIAIKNPFSLVLLAVIAVVLGYLSVSSRPRRSR